MEEEKPPKTGKNNTQSPRRIQAKDILAVTGFQSQHICIGKIDLSERTRIKIRKEILDIRKVHKDYGYRRIWGELRNRNIFVNKKKFKELFRN